MILANIGPFVQPRQQKKGMSGSWSAFAISWVNGWENSNFYFLLWFIIRVDKINLTTLNYQLTTLY